MKNSQLPGHEQKRNRSRKENSKRVHIYHGGKTTKSMKFPTGLRGSSIKNRKANAKRQIPPRTPREQPAGSSNCTEGGRRAHKAGATNENSLVENLAWHIMSDQLPGRVWFTSGFDGKVNREGCTKRRKYYLLAPVLSQAISLQVVMPGTRASLHSSLPDGSGPAPAWHLLPAACRSP